MGGVEVFPKSSDDQLPKHAYGMVAAFLKDHSPNDLAYIDIKIIRKNSNADETGQRKG